jgi:hypothetical protein
MSMLSLARLRKAFAIDLVFVFRLRARFDSSLSARPLVSGIRIYKFAFLQHRFSARFFSGGKD